MMRGPTITRLRDGATAPAVPASRSVPLPPVVRPFCPPPPPAPLPLMRYPRTDNPYATKKGVRAGLDSVREEIRARFANDTVAPAAKSGGTFPNTIYGLISAMKATNDTAD